MLCIDVVAVEREPLGVRCPIAARLDAENEFGRHEAPSGVVEQQRVDAVAERVVHARGDEDVLVAVGVEVADADAPGPVVLEPEFIGSLDEAAVALVVPEGVAEQVVARVLKEALGVLDDRLRHFFFGTDLGGHVGVHVGEEEVEVAVVVEVEGLDAHGAPGRLWKHPRRLGGEAAALVVHVVVIVALHAGDVQVRIAVALKVDDGRVTAP